MRRRRTPLNCGVKAEPDWLRCSQCKQLTLALKRPVVGRDVAGIGEPSHELGYKAFAVSIRSDHGQYPTSQQSELRTILLKRRYLLQLKRCRQHIERPSLLPFREEWPT